MTVMSVAINCVLYMAIAYGLYRNVLAVNRSMRPLCGPASLRRVEKRRSDGSLPVATGGAFATPPQSGLT